MRTGLCTWAVLLTAGMVACGGKGETQGSSSVADSTKDDAATVDDASAFSDTGQPDGGAAGKASNAAAPDGLAAAADASVVGDTITEEPDASDDGGASSSGPLNVDALPPRCQGALHFDDPGIEAQVRANLDAGSDPITAEQAASLTSVGVDTATSFGGLECLVNLTVVDCYGGTVSDLSPLANLMRLREVVVGSSQVSDLSPLSHHPSLAAIEVSNNLVSSLSGLTLPTVTPGACNLLLLNGNLIGPDGVAQACSHGWYVTWGGAYGIDAGSCGTRPACLAP